MKAVILAGGEGQRLLPHTASLPKPMMRIGDRPILEIIIRQLRALDIEQFLLATGYLEESIRSYFGDGSGLGISIRYSRERKPLGTAGPLSLLRRYLSEQFFVINGDVLTDLDFGALLASHRERRNDVTLALANRRQCIDFGVVRLDCQGGFCSWDEKPTFDYLVSTGICVMDSEVLTVLPDDTFLNLPDFIESLKISGARIGGYIHRGYWTDIGRKQDFELACQNAERFSLL